MAAAAPASVHSSPYYKIFTGHDVEGCLKEIERGVVELDEYTAANFYDVEFTCTWLGWCLVFYQDIAIIKAIIDAGANKTAFSAA